MKDFQYCGACGMNKECYRKQECQLEHKTKGPKNRYYCEGCGWEGEAILAEIKRGEDHCPNCYGIDLELIKPNQFIEMADRIIEKNNLPKFKNPPPPPKQEKRLCKICDIETHSFFNIRFQLTPICPDCASIIFIQQANYYTLNFK